MLSAAVRSARAVATTGHGFQSVALTSVGSLRFKSVLPNDVDFNLIDREAPHPVDPLAKNLKPVKFPKFDKQLDERDRFNPPRHPISIENDKAISRLTPEQKSELRLENDRAYAEMMESDAVGDKIVTYHKRQRLRARSNVIWNGNESHVDLSRRDRASPIYFDVKDQEQRMPRVPMPSDLGSDVSPTAALLHAYRLHHARMYLHRIKQEKVIEDFTRYENLDDLDLTIPEIEGADNEGVKMLMESFRSDFKLYPGMGHADKARLLLAIKDAIPHVVNRAQVEVVRTKRRRK